MSLRLALRAHDTHEEFGLDYTNIGVLLVLPG